MHTHTLDAKRVENITKKKTMVCTNYGTVRTTDVIRPGYVYGTNDGEQWTMSCWTLLSNYL